MTEPSGAEFASRTEEELHQTLDVVRRDSPRPGAELTPSIVRTLRWQAMLVVPMTTVLAMAGGLVNGARALFRSRSTR